MRTGLWLLLGAHVLALLFGLGGLLIALPHPELWAGSAAAAAVFNLGMQYAGQVHIVLGAMALTLFGGLWVGWRRTLVFFALSVVLSLGMELLGTGTGWPFGAYEYTAGLGYKVLGRVPYTIPLSWFYMGFSSYLLATAIVAGRGPRPRAVWAVVLGVWLLTVWDLVLDPAMAHEHLPFRFWTWHQTGPYFGMPVQNFVGWSATGLLFMACSRLLWRGDAVVPSRVAWLPLMVYVANTVFAMALSLSVGLWQPVLAAGALGLLPAAVALGKREDQATSFAPMRGVR